MISPGYRQQGSLSKTSLIGTYWSPAFLLFSLAERQAISPPFNILDCTTVFGLNGHVHCPTFALSPSAMYLHYQRNLLLFRASPKIGLPYLCLILNRKVALMDNGGGIVFRCCGWTAARQGSIDRPGPGTFVAKERQQYPPIFSITTATRWAARYGANLQSLRPKKLFRAPDPQEMRCNRATHPPLDLLNCGGSMKTLEPFA